MNLDSSDCIEAADPVAQPVRFAEQVNQTKSRPRFYSGIDADVQLLMFTLANLWLLSASSPAASILLMVVLTLPELRLEDRLRRRWRERNLNDLLSKSIRSATEFSQVEGFVELIVSYKSKEVFRDYGALLLGKNDWVFEGEELSFSNPYWSPKIQLSESTFSYSFPSAHLKLEFQEVSGKFASSRAFNLARSALTSRPTTAQDFILPTAISSRVGPNRPYQFIWGLCLYFVTMWNLIRMGGWFFCGLAMLVTGLGFLWLFGLVRGRVNVDFTRDEFDREMREDPGSFLRTSAPGVGRSESSTLLPRPLK